MESDENAGLKYIKLNHFQVFENIEQDKKSNPALRQSFYDFLAKYDGKTDFQEFCNGFFYQNKLKGDILDVEDKEHLGRVVAKTVLAEHLSSELLRTSPSKSRSVKWIQKNLDDIARVEDNSISLRMLKRIFSSCSLQRYMMWSFRNPQKKDSAFSGIDIAKLPCILALANGTSSISMYAFGHILPDSIKPQLPTFSDAGIYEEWRPGGLTKPLQACNTHEGLEEIVHKPHLFINITHEFSQII
ncbi:MAG: hypothetical protein JKX76_02850 [Colwellia sp.]|nr:hypothetical protein [Colwellia sp.]